MGTFSDLLHQDGEDNIAGMAQGHYIAPWDKINNFPRTNGGTADGDSVVWNTGIWGFETGECFTRLYSTLDSAEVQDKMVGEADGKSYETTFEFTYPGSKKEALEAVSEWKNRGCVIIAVEANGQKRVIGNPLFRATLKDGSFKSGKKTSDGKKTTIIFETRGLTPAPILDDSVNIPITPAS